MFHGVGTAFVTPSLGVMWGKQRFYFMEADDVDLIARIYDTALDPSIWPELMLRISHKLGARGAFIFELRLDDQRPQIASRIFSANYVPEIVRHYLIKFNDEEIKDQGRFAELSQQGDAVDLISDIELRANLSELMAQPNIAFMMTHGLKHRAGALLNKDLVNVDRFALQYSGNHGPITQEEVKKAALFMPHIAKVIGLSRPLEAQLGAKGVFEDILRNVGQGIAVLSPRGTILYANTEFERCISEHRIFRKTANGVLQLAQTNAHDNLAKRYHDLIASDDAHGLFGARARREAIVINQEKPGTALFIEICPVQSSERTGHLGQGCRLVTIIDTSRSVKFDMRRLKSFYQLTASEIGILELIAQGHTYSEISEMRNRSQDTVKSQIKSLMRKTNSQSRTDLVHMIHNLSSDIGYSAEH
jgi:DNA-binding CsgD family transcriptional regulator/PAS domain-containing protein